MPACWYRTKRRSRRSSAPTSSRVETTGAVVTDTTYAEYGDWNWDDYQADIMLPRRMTRKQGDTTLELHDDQHEHL